jgi:hypothetical protein
MCLLLSAHALPCQYDRTQASCERDRTAETAHKLGCTYTAVRASV